MIYDESTEYRDRDALKELLDAVREWAEPKATTKERRASAGRLEAAEAALAGVDVEDLYDAIYERGLESGREQERAVHFG